LARKTSEGGVVSAEEAVTVRVLFLGGFDRQEDQFSISGEEVSVGELFKMLAEKYADAFEAGGDPRPGILVFIDGVDSRLLSSDVKVRGEAVVKIVKVYHGG